MKDLQQGEYFETLDALSYLKEYSNLFDERYQKAIDVAYNYIRDSEARTLTKEEIRNLSDWEKEPDWRKETPIWLEGEDNEGSSLNCYATLNYFYWDGESEHEMICDLFGTEICRYVDIDDYGKTWIAWNRKPADDMIGKCIRSKPNDRR